MAASAPVDNVHRVISIAVDADFYRMAHPDLDRPGLNPARHYMNVGWREGRDPAPWFSSTGYLRVNPDVRAAQIEPLYHFLIQGRREGREVRPSDHCGAYFATTAALRGTSAWCFDVDVARTTPSELVPGAAHAPFPPLVLTEADERDRDLIGPEFDADYYLMSNPDVAAAGVDLLTHFVALGWREGRDPSPAFSVKDYLETYQDIAKSGMHPFAHYVRTGRAEGRIARIDLSFRYEIITGLRPLAERAAEASAACAALEPDSATTLARALATSRTGLRDLHVTFSHDDYTAHLGGVQLCLRREAAHIAALGRDHLHIYPAQPSPMVRADGEPGHLGVVWNGEGVGCFIAGVIASVLRKVETGGGGGERSFAIHSLLGHTADETVDILAAVGLRAGYFWLHDFASLCAGVHLLRNDVQDCAAPPPDSEACRICAYGAHRAQHLTAHERLFQRLELTVVSPSETTLRLWENSCDFSVKATAILPHARLVERAQAPVSREHRPLRIAYLGWPAAHKGWLLFRDLVMKYAKDRRYAFLHLGRRPQGRVAAKFHEVMVSERRPRLMQETLEALEVDVAFIWPLCRETFSFVAYEATAAGCAVVTGPDSGNVAAFVEETGHGWVAPDEAALMAALDSGQITELARSRHEPKLYDLSFSALTADLIGGLGRE